MKALLLVISLVFSISAFAEPAARVRCSMLMTDASYEFQFDFRTPTSVYGMIEFSTPEISGKLPIPNQALSVLETEQHRIVNTHLTIWDFTLKSISIPNEVFSDSSVAYTAEFETLEGIIEGSCKAE